MNLSLSDLKVNRVTSGRYQEESIFPLSCSCYMEVFFTTMSHVESANPHISIPLLNMSDWRDEDNLVHEPPHTSLWESVNHLTPTSPKEMIWQNRISERAQERCRHQHQPSAMKGDVQRQLVTSGPTSESRSPNSCYKSLYCAIND